MKHLLNVASALVAIGMMTPAGIVHAVDANFNSQLSNIRSAATPPPGGAIDPSLGFDPCDGGINTAGICTGAPASSLLSSVNVGISGTPGVGGTVVGIFSTLGPGAVTDNMFGVISGPALGANGAIGGAGPNDGDTPITNCAPGTGTLDFDTTLPTTSLNGLNCGSIRIDATQQGQRFPTGQNTLGLEGNGAISTVIKNMSFIDDKCPGGVCPGDPHVGFDLMNNFSFTMNQDINGNPIQTEATTISSQQIRQVTGVNPGAGIGTLTAPLGGDQVFQVTSNFTAQSPDTAAGSTLVPLLVDWTQDIIDPDQSGTAGATFSQSLGGSFTRDAQFNSRNQLFTCGPVNPATEVSICTQYPSGASQTAGDVAGAELP